ncbi:hypothetical protein J2W25_006730 [Variovorax boronicumulans]|uniref:MORN repeat-containing protein n=1 Tax=Variovorax boronicumulans TaxID=436515 RepID=A0AAW8E8Q4_9BURK|nr:hypothetical protein [Variovorax boronicumulans]MDP9882390.1 hypothetical protein [Variovorax boronicumulans]MDP9927676.1 hypothetical protein [Variovorax boronicumulans]
MTITAREPDAVSHRSLHGLVQAIQTSTHFLSALAVSACGLFISTGTQAQVKPEIANCIELKDETILAQAEMCSAHIGCVYVLNAQKTCAQAKGYLERLQTAIGEGTRTFFGSYRKEVTPDAVFTAELNSEDRASDRALDARPDVQRRTQNIGTRVREVGTGDTLSGKINNGTTWVYYGQVRDGKQEGVGTVVFSDGEIQRGEFRQDLKHGALDILHANGDRFVGEFVNDKRLGAGVYGAKNGSTLVGRWTDTGAVQGIFTRTDGSRFEGLRVAGRPSQGREYRTDGTLAEEGRYENGKLSVGTQYDVAGVRTEVNLQAARELAREAAVREAGEKVRMAAEIENRRKREEAVRAEQQFQMSLQTMNPGQLFARADELNAQGEETRAREVQRALMSRFPDHPLTATAARQMAGESRVSPAPVETSRTGSQSGASSTASQVSLADCAPERDAVVARWRANDSTEENIKRQLANVLADVNSADRARAMKNLEQYQQIALKGSTPYPPLVFSVCMLKVRLTRLAAAPSVAGDTSGGLASVAVAVNPSARRRLSGQTCEAMKQTVMTTRVPSNASVTASTETVMFMTKTVLDMIAGGCPTDSSTPAQIEAERQERQRQYTAAESACNAVQSGGRRCVPRVHTAAEVSRPAVSSATQSTQQQGTISYDPVTGRCLGEGCCSLPGIAGQPQCSGSSRSSGGGIRTAR